MSLDNCGVRRDWFLGALFLLLLALKLTGLTSLSWWWVTAPMWGPLAVALVIVTVVYGARTVRWWFS